jgi:TonB-linked SusC/RagA family outer membrane protein
MKKNFELWGHSNPPLRKLIMELKIALFILLISVSNIKAFPANSSITAVASETELQQLIVSGTVTDAATGEAMAGVNISVKGTTIGAISGADGKYTLPSAVNNNATLVYSFIGYVSQEVPIAGKTVVNVALVSETKNLEEVVVIGYGSVKKETLTGSVASVTSSNIVSTKTSNLVQNIQGKVAGLLVRQISGQPGTFNDMVSIRGFGSPLVVIDGITRDGTTDMSQLNPEDIESMSVLKDAAASIYGMNAANGVIIVTTKKGFEGKAKFSYSNLFGIKSPTGLEGTVDAYTYRVMKNEMDRNTGTAQTYTQAMLDLYKAGAEGYQDVDWLKLFLADNVFQQSHNISVRGGTSTVKYFNSLGYSEDNGLLKTGLVYYKRYNLRSTITADISKNVKLNVDVGGRFDARRSPREDFIWTYKTLIVNDRGINWHTIANPNHLTVIAPESKNAWALVRADVDGYNTTRHTQFQTTVDLTFTVPQVPGLSFTATGAFDNNFTNSAALQKSYDLYDYYTDLFVSRAGADTYSSTFGMSQRGVARGQVGYVKTIGKHRINATGVVEFTATRSDNLSGARNYSDLFTNDILNQGTSTTASNSGSRSFGRYAAYIGRINYDYAGKYLIELVGRDDGSYRYAKVNRWAFFPSVSAGWRISEESFIKNNLPMITNLKLRVSYGQTGSDAGSAFAYYSAYSVSAGSGYVFNAGSLTAGATAPGVVSDQMSWTTSTISNIGLDLDLWNGKLGGTVEVFNRETTGILASVSSSVPNTFGASLPQVNINSNRNVGFEISVSHRSKIGSSFNYGVTGNLTYSRSETLHNENSGYTSSANYFSSSSSNRFSGRMGMYHWNGQFTSKEQYETAPVYGGAAGNSKMLPGSYILEDRDGNGVISSGDNYNTFWNYGTNPPEQFGITLDASFKGFDLNALFQGATKYTLNYRNNDIWGYGRYPTMEARFMDRWHTVNITDDPYNPATQWVPGYFPALRNYNYDNTQEASLISVWRPNATYLRMKTIELGYSLPKKIAAKIGMDSGRIFVNGYNLITICDKLLKKADPERQEADWDADLSYPLMKSYNFGFSINF